MQRLSALLGSLFFLVLAPGIVAGVIPWWITRWQIAAHWPGHSVLRVVAILWILAALPVLLESFARFALKGMGTPAPVYPTQHLVVSGFYRRVRNPMYVAVVSLVLGQALLLSSTVLLAYGIALFCLFHLFVVTYEEPTLRLMFGVEYETFRAHVPRWIPRLQPWRQPKGAE